MASRILRTYNLDHDLVAEIDAKAPPGKRSELANQLLMEALEARRQRRMVAQGLVQAGVGITAMVFLFVLGALLL